MSTILKQGKFQYILIFTVVFLIFSPTLGYDFVNWDDDVFVLNNASIQKIDGTHLKALFTTLEGACYAPLSRLSVAMDYAFWGKNPFGYRLTSLLLHSFSACLVFGIALLCLRQSRLPEHSHPWGAGLAALLFALHPLRSESVVWISERRDVLALFFALASVWVYLLRTQGKRPDGFYYIGSLLLYGAALLSKASVATLPVVLILLDIFLLQRLTLPFHKTQSGVLLEKIPFLVSGVGIGFLASKFQIESGAAPEFQHASALSILSLSCASNGKYLLKLLGWIYPLNPLDLIHHYYSFSQPEVWGSGWVLLSITAGVFFLKRSFPTAALSWLAYLCLILPFTGFVQAGGLLTADRYTYLASVPLALFLGGCYAKGWAAFRVRPRLLKLWSGVGLLMILFLSSRTIQQNQIWSSSESLWRQAVQLDPHNPYAWRKLGDACLQAEGPRLQEAYDCFLQAAKLTPLHHDTWFDLAYVTGQLGKLDEAGSIYRQIIKDSPRYAKAHFNLGWIMAKQGRLDLALQEYEAARKLEPSPMIWFNMGICYESQKNNPKALEAYRQAAQGGFDEAWIRWSYLASQKDPNRGKAILQQALNATQSLRVRFTYARMILTSKDASESEKREAEAILEELDRRTHGKSLHVNQLKKAGSQEGVEPPELISPTPRQ